MAIKLIEAGAEPGKTREILIAKDEFLIGRGADCDLRLHTAAVSRHHCLLRQRAGELTVLDLGSSNGTFVNDQRVRSQSLVRNGDCLRVGTFDFLVELDAQSGIDWGGESSGDSEGKTLKLKGGAKLRPPGEKEGEGHRPGEAGGTQPPQG
jgi:pSer/pThr/pTyr-binding forkhead associated (FHA) protein